MKKILIGGFFTVSGMIGAMILIAVAIAIPTSAWVTPPGRLICTILENGAAVPLIVSLVLLAAGLFILTIEYFKKDV